MRIGTTYSHRRIQELRLDNKQAFAELLSLKLDLIRLCVYWDEVQPEEGQYDYSQIEHLLTECEQHNQPVIVTVGMKAPRWPEFYIPRWIQDKNNLEHGVLTFINKTISSLQKYSCITHWQIENEPLDPSGPKHKTIPYELLLNEVQAAKRTDARPILVTLWGNELSKRKLLPKVTDIADVIGIDIYYKHPVGKWFTTGPKDSDKKLCDIVGSCNKPIWIAELQAEPWGKVGMDVTQLENNLKRASTLGCDTVLLWGYEYWYWQKTLNNSTMIEMVKNIKNMYG